MIKNSYNLVMNSDKNAFSSLPKTTKFQLMTVLAYMWSVVFSLGVGSYIIFGTSVVFHMLILTGTFLTADMFYKAREGKLSNSETYKD